MTEQHELNQEGYQKMVGVLHKDINIVNEMLEALGGQLKQAEANSYAQVGTNAKAVGEVLGSLSEKLHSMSKYEFMAGFDWGPSPEAETDQPGTYL